MMMIARSGAQWHSGKEGDIMTFQYNDGGRARAGYKGSTGDCVCLVRTLSNGDVTREWLSPLEAVTDALTGTQNGLTVVSCRIEGDMVGWDMSYVPVVAPVLTGGGSTVRLLS